MRNTSPLRILQATLLSLMLLLPLAATAQDATLRLPSVIGDNMLLQRDMDAPIWGWTAPGGQVTVDFSGQTKKAKADKTGKWMVRLSPLKTNAKASTMKITSGEETITVKNILVGEVWLCSGQSNMEWTLSKSEGGKDEAAEADFPNIRLYKIGARTSVPEPLDECPGDWKVCSPESTPPFSGVAYFFGKKLHKDLNIPIGLVQSAWGGSTAQAWTPTSYLSAYPELAPIAEREKIKKPAANHASSHLYNGMLHPLIPFAIRGAIWYQGESNVGNAYEYRTLFPVMIHSWRETWNQKAKDFPFYFVEIAPYQYGKRDPSRAGALSELREAQTLAMQWVANTGMAGTIDIGNTTNIHPTNKLDVGNRLARWALVKDYGKNMEYIGPLYDKMTKEDGKIRIELTHANGLKTSDGEAPTCFTIAGRNKKFVPAQAKIENGGITVWSDAIKRPVAVRFAWNETDVPNLVNSAGLPAPSFRTDTWPGVTWPKELK